MKKLTATLCLTLTLLLGSVGNSESADFQKGLTAYKSGDYATAMREWTPLAKQGDAFAQSNLGLMYEDGTGVLQDYVRAHMWYNIASISGKSKNASKNREIVAKRMTPKQIEKAQNLARECVRKKYKGC
jgi:TPR repeat protein